MCESVVDEPPRTVPAEIVDCPPGSRLGVLLESIDRSGVDVGELELVLRARARQIWHLQAELLIDLYVLARAVRERIGVAPEVWRQRQVCESVGWRLGWSVWWTQVQLDLADALVTRFPEVFAAVRAGRLDPARAQAFVELLSGVDDAATVRWIVDRLLPKAPGWTLAELRERLRYHVQRRAPQAARRRYQRRVVERDVQLRPEPDGTASLAGVGLPADRAMAAFDRIDRLARAARAAGDPRTLSQLRGDAFTDLLAGVPFQITPSVDALTADADARYPHFEPGADQPPGAVPDQPPSHADQGRSPGCADQGRSPGAVQGRRPGPGDFGVSAGGEPGGDLVWADELGSPPPDPDDVIDEYDYERWFGCPDDDQRWTDHPRADASATPVSAVSTDMDSWLGTGNPADKAAGVCRAVMEDQVSAGIGGAEPDAGHRPKSGSRDPKPLTSTQSDSRFETGNSVVRVLAGPRAVGGSWFGTGNLAGEKVLPSRITGGVRWGTGDPAGVVAGDRCARCGGRLVARPGVVQVSVRLATLLGRDDHPGLLAGFGPVPADVARQIAVDPFRNPLWRWSIFDRHGDLLHHGTTTRRPAPAPTPPATSPGPHSRSAAAPGDRPCTCARIEIGHRRSEVEIQLTPADLTTGHDPRWAEVIADIAAQAEADARANPPDKWSQVDDHGRLRHHGHTGRYPTADEAAFIRARDRTCRAPHCHRPATTCDLDHALEHHRGGPSHRGNCRCLCRRHHTLRHLPGVQVTDHPTGHGRVTTWTLPDGRTHHVTRDKDIILAIGTD
jgi:hypothetical protein